MKLAHFEFDPKTDLLGEGPLSEVYRARDTRLDRVVALKILRPQVEIDPQADQRFLNEARHTAAQGHPNITTVYEYAQIPDGPSYIAMEYLEGRTLDKIIAERNLDYNECLRIALALTDALAGVHSLDMIHRDLKPANVMLLNDGEIKLLDFGIARVKNEASITQHGMLVGTVLYMSPEQVRGEELDARSDVFSLGALLYHVITGELPFPGTSFPQVCMAILDGEPRKKPSEVRQGFPEPLETFLLHCMERDPGQRFSNARKAHDALLLVQHQLAKRAPMGLRGKLYLPEFVCAPGDPCSIMAGALRKDIANELDRNKGLEVLLEAAPQDGAPGEYALIVELRVQAQKGELNLQLKRLGAPGTLEETFGAEDDDEWALQEALARAAVRFVRRGLTGGFAGDVSPQSKQAELVTLKARRIIHKGTSKHLLIGISLLRQALDLDRYCALAHAVLSEAKVRKFLYWEGDPSFLDEAREHAARALDLDANCAEAHTALGFAYHLSGHAEDARREYRLAIRLNPGEWFAHRLLGTALVRTGNLQNAEPALRQAIRLRPQYIACYDHLYNVLRNLDRADEAKVVAEEGLHAAQTYLKDVPDDLEARLHMGHLAARLGRRDLAETTVEQSLKLAPKDGYTHFHIATIRALCEDADGALNALRTAQDRGYYLRSELGNTDLDLLRGNEAFESLAS